jgi:hypothetical protein
MIRTRGIAKITGIVLGSALAVLPTVTASAESTGSSGARSVAAALVADFESGKFSTICSLTLPSAQSACSSEVKGELEGTHPSFPDVRLSSVSVHGDQATYTMSCSGAGYCGNFAGANVSQAMVKQNGKWYLLYNSANFGNFALSINSGSGTSNRGKGQGHASTEAKDEGNGNGSATDGSGAANGFTVGELCRTYATDLKEDTNKGKIDLSSAEETENLSTDFIFLSSEASGPLGRNLNTAQTDFFKFTIEDETAGISGNGTSQSQANAFNKLMQTITTEINSVCAGGNSGNS